MAGAPATRDPAAAGNLYGTTANGGTSGSGAAFTVDSTGTETTLHSFVGSDGTYPFGGLIRDSAGNLYGTTNQGGGGGGGTFCLNGCGTVFKLAPNSDGTWT